MVSRDYSPVFRGQSDFRHFVIDGRKRLPATNAVLSRQSCR